MRLRLPNWRMPNVRLTVLSAALLAAPVILPAGARAADDPPPPPPPARDQPPPPRGERPDPATMLDKVHAAVKELNLTDEQKPKIEEQFAKAHKELDALKSETGPDRAQAAFKALGDLREGVGGILTDDQKKELGDKLQKAGIRPPGQGRPGGPGGAFRAAVEKLDLSAEQKTKVDDVLKEQREKIAEIIKDANGDRAAAGEKIRPLMEESRKKMEAILTPEQQTKLQELLKEQRGGGDRPPGDPPKPPGGTKPDAKDEK